MNDSTDQIPYSGEQKRDELLSPGALAKHAALFLVTFATCTIAGLVWQNDMDLANIAKGIPYSLSLLFILSCHEFGHYFAARYHKVRVTLPFYIPLPPLPGFFSFGTLGAVIRTKQPIPSRKALFDIGIAGPIAGFVASIAVLIFGFSTLPGHEFLLAIHPGYDFASGTSAHTGGLTLTFGSTMLYQIIGAVVTPAGDYLPPMTEMYHYPFLITGWFGLLVTALNLLPAGQLDGGHISYAMFGSKHRILARITVVLLFVLGITGILPGILEYLGFSEVVAAVLAQTPAFGSLFWPGWLFWALLILIVVKVEHPPVDDPEPLDPRRKLLGWFAWVMFILSFSPAPIYFQ